MATIKEQASLLSYSNYCYLYSTPYHLCLRTVKAPESPEFFRWWRYVLVKWYILVFLGTFVAEILSWMKIFQSSWASGRNIAVCTMTKYAWVQILLRHCLFTWPSFLLAAIFMPFIQLTLGSRQVFTWLLLCWCIVSTLLDSGYSRRAL